MTDHFNEASIEDVLEAQKSVEAASEAAFEEGRAFGAAWTAANPNGTDDEFVEAMGAMGWPIEVPLPE